MGLVLKKGLLRRSKLLRRAVEECGAEAFEAAIVLPLLLTLLIGIVWVGRAYNVYETMTRAAREGARFAVAPTCATCGNAPPSDSEVMAVINAALSASSLDPSKVNPAICVQRSVNIEPSNPSSVTCPSSVLCDPTSGQVCGIVVAFGYPFTFVIPFTSLNLTTITIRTQVQMRQEF